MNGLDRRQKRGQAISDFHLIEEQNLTEIESLNQRGGRMLSMVDLLEAETVSVEMAGYLLFAMRHGASVLTGARPGGAGKTALLGAILDLLPPGEQIVTVGRREVLRSAPPKPACFLVHEIGSGPYYGYLWGDDVPLFIRKAAEGYRIGATIHADDAEEVRNELSVLGVSSEDLNGGHPSSEDLLEDLPFTAGAPGQHQLLRDLLELQKKVHAHPLGRLLERRPAHRSTAPQEGTI